MTKFIIRIVGSYPHLTLCFPHCRAPACVLLLESSLSHLHIRDEPTGTSGATYRLMRCWTTDWSLLHPVTGDTSKEAGSRQERRKWRRGEGKGEISVSVNLQHWSYGARSMPRKHWVFRGQSCQCLKNLLLGKHRLPNLEASMLVKLVRIFTGQGNAQTSYKVHTPMQNFKPLLQGSAFLNETCLPLISSLETVALV